MNISRREFIAGGAAAVGAGTVFAAAKTASVQRQDGGVDLAVQLYSIGKYITKNGLDKALAEVATVRGLLAEEG